MIAEAQAIDTKSDADKLNALFVCFSASVFALIYLHNSWINGTAPSVGIAVMFAVLIAVLFPRSGKLLLGMCMVIGVAVSSVCLAHAYVFSNLDTMPRWMFQRQLGAYDKDMPCLPTGCKPDFSSIADSEYQGLRDACKPLGVMQTRYSADEKFVYVRCGRGFTAMTMFAERDAFEGAELKFKQRTAIAAKEKTL